MQGIFQYHQGLALSKAGFKVGALSVRQSLSVPMVIKAILMRLVGRVPNNELRGKTALQLLGIFRNKFFRIADTLRIDRVENIDVVRVEGFYWVPSNWHSNDLAFRAWRQSGLTAFKRYLKEFGRPDVVHSHNAIWAGLLSEEIKRRYGIPYVLTEHSSYVGRALYPTRIHRFLRRAYNASAAFLVVSPFLGESIDRILGKPLQRWKYLPNILDPFFEEAPSPGPGPTSSVFRFVNIGSLIPVKRQDDLLRAFAQAFGAGAKSVQLDIAGDGELRGRLSAMAESLGIFSSVNFLGKLNREEILSLLDNCDCLISSSEFETFGVSLIEALSRGKPVVATDCGGPNAIIVEGNGILCKTHCVDSIARAMQCVRERRSLYEADAIRDDALRRFGHENFVGSVSEEYERALHRCG